MKPQLQHVSIPRPPGSDEITRQFYGGVLGLEEKPVPTSITSFDLIWFYLTGNTELHVFADNDTYGIKRNHFCLVVDDLDGTRQKIIDAGHEVDDAPTIFGRPRFFCRDPFGNQIEFTAIEDDYMKYQGQSSDE